LALQRSAQPNLGRLAVVDNAKKVSLWLAKFSHECCLPQDDDGRELLLLLPCILVAVVSVQRLLLLP
jgi:hypothetical protein